MLIGQDLRQGPRSHNSRRELPPPAQIQYVIGVPNGVRIVLDTNTEFPRSRNPSSVRNNLSLSRWCNPIWARQNIKHPYQTSPNSVSPTGYVGPRHRSVCHSPDSTSGNQAHILQKPEAGTDLFD